MNLPCTMLSVRNHIEKATHCMISFILDPWASINETMRLLIRECVSALNTAVVNHLVAWIPESGTVDMEKTQYSDFQLGGSSALLFNLELLKDRPYLTFRKTQNYEKRGRENSAVISKSWKCGRKLTTKGRRELWGWGWSGPKFLL